MNYQKSFLCIIVSFLFITSCNPASNDEPSNPSITPGFYGLEAQSISVDGKAASARSIGGGYLSERFQFFEGNSLQIKVKSDIVNENGFAEATYQIQDSHLSVNIASSSTSKYAAGEKVTFTNYKVIDESFTRTFGSDSTSYTFTGPGLLLESQYTDKQDLDDDGNTSETVTRTEFYSYFVKYDDGGL